MSYECFKKCSFKKGSQYFNCEYGGQNCKNEAYDIIKQYNRDVEVCNEVFRSKEKPLAPVKEYYVKLSFSMETGDMKRAGGKKAKDLDF